MTEQSEQNLILRDCIERMETLGLPYMLTGSLALSHYAMPRAGRDIDLIFELSNENYAEFIEEFKRDYYVSQWEVRDAVYRRTLFSVLHRETIIKVDFFIRKKIEFHEEAFSRRKRLDFAFFYVWIIGKEDLILSKLISAKNNYSKLQMRDVVNILRNGYDETRVESWAKKLGVTDLLTAAKGKLEKLQDDPAAEEANMQNDLWMKRTPQERARAASAGFAAAKDAIIASLPEDLPERELKKQLYHQIYGGELPEDFFKHVD